MRVLFAFVSVVLLGCAENAGGNSAPAPAVETSAYRAITTQAEFNSLVVGKLLTHKGDNAFTIRADGTLDGDFNGPLAGTWRWADGYWCRILTVPEVPRIVRRGKPMALRCEPPVLKELARASSTRSKSEEGVR